MARQGFASLKARGNIDVPLFVITLILIGMGTVMVYSSSFILAEENFGTSSFFLKRRIFHVALSLAVMLFMVRVDYRSLRRWSIPLLLLAIFLLLLVFVPNLSSYSGPVKGARRWIKLAGFTIQPAEVMKLALVIYLADSLARRQEKLASFRQGLLPYLIILGLIFSLMVFQPDFGTAITILIVAAIMLFVGKTNLKHLFALGVAGLPLLYLLVFTAGYRKDRVLAFLNPEQVSPDLSYQANQSVLGLGAGGIWGVGLGQSKQKLFYLPEPHTDFVFSIIGEELGFIGALAILTLFLFLAWQAIKVARSAPDLFGFLLSVGITSIIFVHVIINVGVACNLLPTTGLPLPFISYGGSSLLLSSAGVGMLLSISRQGRPGYR